MSKEKWDRNRSLLSPGELEIVINENPVSLQASRRRKDIVTSAIHKITSKCEFILTDDVQIYIEWWIHEQDRYESDSSADVDNIIKPILDAISGPDGILIDDCQVQAVDCRWLDFFSVEQKINIRIKMFDRDGWLLKDGLFFVHMGNGLCYPTWMDKENPENTLSVVEQMEIMLLSRDKVLDKKGDYYLARGLMSVQRIFHISRAKGFPIFKIEEIKGEIGAMIEKQKSKK
ncbi:RusA family crossover junction endodeoxyribonuclease [Nodosilinea sp. LEGE 07298]|uniref:RusA family crossover junction endodeoxyribonuclease n=1 Tax=Nodosilinea sp. LEGE 07298 TaxID=2777970 RepID=UPI00187F7FC4|nr:RusA family crossover junction endodeoxyribonuclease [Nodosilinea sp. LEGE 07298]MBE9108672.1 RusA family crossover junction endodeoxyribonuclease [Nodosilinea sp. LEGE 07298]